MDRSRGRQFVQTFIFKALVEKQRELFNSPAGSILLHVDDPAERFGAGHDCSPTWQRLRGRQFSLMSLIASVRPSLLSGDEGPLPTPREI